MENTTRDIDHDFTDKETASHNKIKAKNEGETVREDDDLVLAESLGDNEEVSEEMFDLVYVKLDILRKSVLNN